MGRKESLLEKVKDELKAPDVGQHSVLVGDVGDQEFWRLLKKEVSYFGFVIKVLLGEWKSGRWGRL